MDRSRTMYQPLVGPMTVVDAKFVVPYSVDLTIVKKVTTFFGATFEVMDANGRVMFKTKGKLVTLHDRQTLLDADKRPVLSLYRKLISAHRRWQVFKGESSDAKDLLFSVKQTWMIQFKTSLDIFIASNTTEQACDFKVKGNWVERSCTVYAGGDSTDHVVAQLHKKHTLQSVVQGKEIFSVTVNPNVDYAFISALLVILDEINYDKIINTE